MDKTFITKKYSHVPFTYEITLTATGTGLYGLPMFGSRDPVAMIEFMPLVEKYIRRIRERVYRKSHKHRNMNYYGFFEDKTKDGLPCYAHCYICFAVEPEFEQRFLNHHKREWEKIVTGYRTRLTGRKLAPGLRHANAVLTKLHDVQGALDYCTKHAFSNSWPPIICLPDYKT